MFKQNILQSICSNENKINRFIKSNIIDIMDIWNEEGNDHELDFMNKMVNHLYSTGELYLESEDEYDINEEIFEDMISLDSLYVINNKSILYTLIKGLAKKEHRKISEYLPNLINFEFDNKGDMLCTDVIIKDYSFAQHNW